MLETEKAVKMWTAESGSADYSPQASREAASSFRTVSAAQAAHKGRHSLREIVYSSMQGTRCAIPFAQAPKLFE